MAAAMQRTPTRRHSAQLPNSLKSVKDSRKLSVQSMDDYNSNCKESLLNNSHSASSSPSRSTRSESSHGRSMEVLNTTPVKRMAPSPLPITQVDGQSQPVTPITYSHDDDGPPSPAEDIVSSLTDDNPLTSTPKEPVASTSGFFPNRNPARQSVHPSKLLTPDNPTDNLGSDTSSISSQTDLVSQPVFEHSTPSVSVACTSSTNTTITAENGNASDFQVPIIGYEIMEERSRFTVYKVQVLKSNDENWYIFRRYNDFVRLNEKLKEIFPHFRLALPPKRWLGDNFDKAFLDDRLVGLQAFVNNIVCHREVSHSEPVRTFLCFDEPPGPHDSLEESRAMCDTLEEQNYVLRRELREKDAKIALLEEELALHKVEIENLQKSLRRAKFHNTSGLRISGKHPKSGAEHGCLGCTRRPDFWLERALNAKRTRERSSPSSQSSLRSECSLPEQDQSPSAEEENETLNQLSTSTGQSQPTDEDNISINSRQALIDEPSAETSNLTKNHAKKNGVKKLVTIAP